MLLSTTTQFRAVRYKDRFKIWPGSIFLKQQELLQLPKWYGLKEVE